MGRVYLPSDEKYDPKVGKKLLFQPHTSQEGMSFAYGGRIIIGLENTFRQLGTLL
jgi:hypothetical protein